MSSPPNTPSQPPPGVVMFVLATVLMAILAVVVMVGLSITDRRSEPSTARYCPCGINCPCRPNAYPSPRRPGLGEVSPIGEAP